MHRIAMQLQYLVLFKRRGARQTVGFEFSGVFLARATAQFSHCFCKWLFIVG
jgi:hypothetical protein